MSYILHFMFRGLLIRLLPSWLPIPGLRRFRAAMETMDGILFDIIERRRREGSDSNDLLAVLLDLADAETGEVMTPAQIRDETLAIFLAGFETTAASLSWVFHALVQQPRLARGLEAEVDALRGRGPTFADLPKLPRTLWTVQEALRLYPPAYWIPRTAVEEDEIDGFRIPAGSTVAPMAYAIHRHPAFWDAPEQFDPERFSPERSAGRPPLAWLPFGAGQRQCIGKDFALMEGQLILARAVQRFHFEPIPGRVPRPEMVTTLRPRDGVWVALSRRTPLLSSGA